MDPYHNINGIHGEKQNPRSARITGENDPLNSRTVTDRKYSQSEIAKDNDEDMNRNFQALKTIHGFKIEKLEQLLAEHTTAKATTRLFGQERDAKWAETRDWQVKYDILEKSHKDLQHKFDMIDSEMKDVMGKNQMMDKESKSYQIELQEKERKLQGHERGRHWQVEEENLKTRYKDLQRNFDQHQKMKADKIKIENEHRMLKSIISSKEQELLKEKSEKSQLLKQLQEKERQLQEHERGRHWQMEYENLEKRYQDLQRNSDQHQKMVAEKIKIENEHEIQKSMLRSKEQELLKEKSEKSQLLKLVEIMDKESKSYQTQLQEKERKLQELERGRRWQVEYENLEKRYKDLQRNFDQHQMMIADKIKIENELQMLKSIISSKEQELLKEKSEKSQLLKQLQEKERQLQEHERGRHWQMEYENLEKRYKDLQRNFDQHQMMIAEKFKIENEHQMLKSMFSSREQELLREKHEKSQLLECVEKMDQESESLKAHLQEKEKQLEEQREATKKAYAEKNDALTRLSHMGHQMSEGNPNNTDLSDPNRPSKLGERYSDLYDNEWINAFEVLMETFDMDEKEAIDVLRNILLESYKSAFDISRSQMEEAEYKLAGSTKAVSPECKQLLKEALKHIDIKQSDSLLKNALERSIKKTIDKKFLNETIIQVFAKECFQLCWLMSVQDPPVVLAEDSIKGDHFDTNMYKHNINSGDTIDYVVWPSLLLHKGGPLLTKGVAQPVPRLRPKSAFSLGENKKTDTGTFDKLSRSLYVGEVQDIPLPADVIHPKLDTQPSGTLLSEKSQIMIQ